MVGSVRGVLMFMLMLLLGFAMAGCDDAIVGAFSGLGR